jgi:hypothetical protein
VSAAGLHMWCAALFTFPRTRGGVAIGARMSGEGASPRNQKLPQQPLTPTLSPQAGRRRSAAFAIALGLLSASHAQAQYASRPVEPPISITIAATPIDRFDNRTPERRRFGALDFIGGLDLTSSYRDFGGISALRMQADGEGFVAVTDRGRWLTGRIVYANDRPVGIKGAVMAPILAADGRPITAHGLYDTESLTADGGTFYVGLERVHRALKFDFDRLGVRAPGERVPLPAEVASLPANKGLETLVHVPAGHLLAGTLIAVSERGLDRGGNIKAWLVGGPTPGPFAVERRDDFDISDGALLPSGDLLLLERRFSWTSGIAVRLRRIAADVIRPGAVVDGPVLMFADMGYQIDNFEALGVHKNAAGDTVLTLMSDDNFSIIQRTLLMQFRLVDE